MYVIGTILQKHDCLKLQNPAGREEERGESSRQQQQKDWSILSCPFRPAGFFFLFFFWTDRQAEEEKERANKISGDGPVSSTHRENVQTGRLESHRWPDTHRRSIMKLWRRQRLLGVCCPELGLRCWCEDGVCVCVCVCVGVRRCVFFLSPPES